MGDSVLDVVTESYLASHDFNGMSVARLKELCDSSAIGHLEQLILDGQIEVLSQNDHVNTHIKCFPISSGSDVQLEAVASNNPHHTCLYPSPHHLRTVVDRSRFEGEPFVLELALGAPQLEFRSFDLAVLELYRNDPRYYYVCGSTHGSISVSDEYFESDEMLVRDQVVMQSFGFSLSADFDRAVAVFLRYLKTLSPEHQQLWKARELTGEYKLHPEYYRTSILGEFPEKMPIFEAFLLELRTINEMSVAMGRPPLFRKVPDLGGEAKEFSFLVRPTQAEYDRFVHALDKVLSDNINKNFFQGEVEAEFADERSDGKILVRPKGTLLMLDEWLRCRFRTSDWAPWDEAISEMKGIRKQRQKPAHALRDDVFDRKYQRAQRELIRKAYTSVRTIRLMMATHPDAASVDVTSQLYEGEICDY